MTRCPNCGAPDYSGWCESCGWKARNYKAQSGSSPSRKKIDKIRVVERPNRVGAVLMVVSAIVAFASLGFSWWMFKRWGIGDSSIQVDVFPVGTILRQWCDPSCEPDFSLLIEDVAWGGGMPSGGNQLLWIPIGGLICLVSAFRPRYGIIGGGVLLLAPTSFNYAITRALRGYPIAGSYSPSSSLTDVWGLDFGFSLAVLATVLALLTGSAALIVFIIDRQHSKRLVPALNGELTMRPEKERKQNVVIGATVGVITGVASVIFVLLIPVGNGTAGFKMFLLMLFGTAAVCIASVIGSPQKEGLRKDRVPRLKEAE